MTENLLTIVFGCLATVLAIAGIVLACLQFRAHVRQPAHNATPSAIENAHSPVHVWTASGRRRSTPRKSDRQNMSPFMIVDGLVLASVSHYIRRSTCCA